MLGGVSELPNEGEKQVVSALDTDLALDVHRLRMHAWVYRLRTAITADESFVGNDYSDYKTRLLTNINAMLQVIRDGRGLSDTSKWLDQDSVAVISGLLGFKYTCFYYSEKYKPSKKLRNDKLRWFVAIVAGDGNDAICFRRLKMFTHQECIERIIHNPRFCTTGTLESDALKPRGVCVIFIRFQPIAMTSQKSITWDCRS